jgi:hypothetical protein
MEARATADAINDFGRDPIGEGREEQAGFLAVFSVSILMGRLEVQS